MLKYRNTVKGNKLVPLKKNQCVSKECKYYRRFGFIKRMKIYDAKLFTCHRASSKLCQHSHTPSIYFSGIDNKNCVPYAKQKVIAIG